jgi:hypothetical protein
MFPWFATEYAVSRGSVQHANYLANHDIAEFKGRGWVTRARLLCLG